MADVAGGKDGAVLRGHRRAGRLAVIGRVRRAAAAKLVQGGETAARSQDFLYGEDGLPR